MSHMLVEMLLCLVFSKVPGYDRCRGIDRGLGAAEGVDAPHPRPSLYPNLSSLPSP